MLKDIEINPQFEKALYLMEESDSHIFVTGKAGTGKSTLLEYFRSITKKQIVVLAPTGVAAVNVSGQTIHSFFGFRPDVTIEKVKREARKRAASIYRNLDMIFIDEISMVRADLLDCVDEFLRINGKEPGLPFGGVQMVFIGDLYQIPPVVVGQERYIFDDYYNSEFFFDARVHSEIEIEHLELERIYRQTDQNFINLLNKIRNKTISEEDISLLNSRMVEDEMTLPQDTIYLTTTNAMAEEKNKEELLKMPGESFIFEAEVEGEIDKKSYPAEELLEIRKDAQVMFLNNDAAGRWINGTIGKVVKVKEEEIVVRLNDGSAEEVESYKWNVFRFYWDEETQSVAADNVGSFRQYPLKLAWAITIHKSQGKTFDNVMIDLGRGAFASGQLYVALSRCRSFSGIFLKKAIRETDIRVDPKVMKFITGRQYDLSEEKLPLDEKVDIIREAIKNNANLEIVYLKNTDEKTSRVIKPESVGMMEYSNRSFLGMVAYCFKRNDLRTFRVDRILEIKSGDTVFLVEGYGNVGKSITKQTGIAGCLDVETTGLSPYSDEIIELALVLFSYDQQGITSIVDRYDGLREPNCEISNGAFKVHGLTKVDLIGYRLDRERIKGMIGKADFLIAHNASFDKGFVTKMFPSSGKKRWYCSMSGVSWYGSRGLQVLLARHGIKPARAHRALFDAEGVIALLSRKNSCGITYFNEMLRGRLKQGITHYDASNKKKHAETYNVGSGKSTFDGIFNANRLSIPKPKEIKLPLLKVIAKKGGEIITKEAYVDVMEQFQQLAAEYKTHHTPSEKVDWEHKVKAARQSLVSDGYIANNSPAGIWRITDKGRKYLQEYSCCESSYEKVDQGNIIKDKSNLKLDRKDQNFSSPERLSLGAQPVLRVEKSDGTVEPIFKTITYSEGIYTGMVLNDKPHGKGTLQFSDVTIISDEWFNGDIKGIVTMNFKNGNSYTGDFMGGKLNGYCSIKYPDGAKIFGDLNNGKLHGQCIYTLANGQKKTLLFRNGEFVGDKKDLLVKKKTTNKNKDLEESFLIIGYILMGEPLAYMEKLFHDFLNNK